MKWVFEFTEPSLILLDHTFYQFYLNAHLLGPPSPRNIESQSEREGTSGEVLFFSLLSFVFVFVFVHWPNRGCGPNTNNNNKPSLSYSIELTQPY